jgi:hypothetical protein
MSVAQITLSSKGQIVIPKDIRLSVSISRYNGVSMSYKRTIGYATLQSRIVPYFLLSLECYRARPDPFPSVPPFPWMSTND